MPLLEKKFMKLLKTYTFEIAQDQDYLNVLTSDKNVVSYSFLDKLDKRLESLTREFYLGVMPSSFLYETIYQDLFRLKDKFKLTMLPVAKTSYYLQEDEKSEQDHRSDL